MAEQTLSAVRGETTRIETEWRALISIALPAVAVQVGLMLMGVVDTLMVGRVSAQALAGVALGNLYVFNVMVVSLGALMSLDPLVSQALGASDTRSVTLALQRGVILAIALAIVTTLAMLPADALLRLFRQPTDIIPSATAYVHINAAGMVPFLVFVVLRQTLQAMGRLAPIVWTIAIANVANAFLNWILIFGHLGAPPLGVSGAAIATVAGRWLMLVLLLALAWRELHPHLRGMDRGTLAFRPLARMLAIGLPIGLQQFLEVSAFAAVGLLMGVFGTIQVASHQIAINMAALTFMVPLGVGAAAAVRVGLAVGARDIHRSKRAARIAYLVGGGFMCLSALLFLLVPNGLAALYTADAAILAIAGALIPIAGVFQVFDGLQAVGAGVLRGLGDTTVPLIAMLSGYWLIGVPVSVFLGFRTDLGPAGLWWGFVAGLASVAVFLFIRVRILFSRGVSRLRVD